MIQWYAPADLLLLGTWFVYGTALGVSDKVVATMKQMNVSIPDLPAGGYLAPLMMHSAFHPVMAYAPPSSGGGAEGW